MSRRARSGGISGPLLETRRVERPDPTAVSTVIHPPGTLYRTALSSRFATRRHGVFKKTFAAIDHHAWHRIARWLPTPWTMEPEATS
jgi:hypothetical protein